MRADTAGRFFAIDGIDGCGKSTQVRLVCQELESRGASVIQTREPGGTDVGMRLREILVSTHTPVDPVSEMLLYFADRMEHQKRVVIPGVAAGSVVVSDRFLPSTYAYQVKGRGLPESLYDSVTRHTVSRMPDATFIIDIAPAVALERAMRRLRRDGKLDDEGKFEQLGEAFFETVRAGFLAYADANESVVIVDGDQSIEAIRDVIINRICEVMG